MKTFYLTMSTGRSGTNKLQTILSCVPNMYAEHDADNKDTSFANVRIANLKDKSVGLNFVKSRLEFYNSLEQSNIANTQHMIASGFFEHFVSLGVIPNIIILRRNPREVALSMWKLNWIPFRNPQILPWFYGPNEFGSLPYQGYESASHYQLCYWWCCETERRIQQYVPWLTALGSKIWETTLTNILNINHVNSMLEYFQLSNINDISLKKVNSYDSIWKKEISDEKLLPDELTLDRLENAVLNNIPKHFKDYLETTWAMVR